MKKKELRFKKRLIRSIVIITNHD